MAAVTDKKPEPTLGEILKNAGRRALGGGLPGAAAMGVQLDVAAYNHELPVQAHGRHGTSTTVALKTLYSQGGILRFYRGIGPALIQGPMSRFGDTAANAGVLALLDSYETTKKLPVGFKTLCASGGAASWRLLLMPVDTVKTILQVEGKQGLPILMQKFKKGGVPVFFQGAIAASGATFVGHFPWFFTYNYLNDTLPKAETKIGKLTRNACMGFCASVVSDTCSNSIRVVKTTKQTSAVPLTYVQSVQLVLKEDGWIGLFGRGLRTRILANALQGMLFSVLWKQFEEMYWKNQRK